MLRRNPAAEEVMMKKLAFAVFALVVLVASFALGRATAPQPVTNVPVATPIQGVIVPPFCIESQCWRTETAVRAEILANRLESYNPPHFLDPQTEVFCYDLEFGLISCMIYENGHSMMLLHPEDLKGTPPYWMTE